MVGGIGVWNETMPKYLTQISFNCWNPAELKVASSSRSFPAGDVGIEAGLSGSISEIFAVEFGGGRADGAGIDVDEK